MQYWLLKTEPQEYSWGDLVIEGGAVWDGVKAPAALKNMLAMRPGDLAFIYHTGKERAVVGTTRIQNKAYPDPDSSNERQLVVSIVPKSALARPVTLAKIKESKMFDTWGLVRLPRLSVVPVSSEQWRAILAWGRGLIKP